MNLSRRHFLVLMPAAAIAWKSVLAGTPEQAENYKMSDHWWGMLIDVPKCIGCGNCVRACAAENDVPDGYFRTWVERYHVSDENMTNPEVISPDGGKEGFPVAKEDAEQVLLRSEDVQPLRGLALHAGLPGGRDICISRRRCADRSEVLSWLCLLRAGLPLRMPLHSSGEEGRRQMHTLLSPHHQGTDNCMLRKLSDRRAPAG